MTWVKTGYGINDGTRVDYGARAKQETSNKTGHGISGGKMYRTRVKRRDKRVENMGQGRTTGQGLNGTWVQNGTRNLWGQKYVGRGRRNGGTLALKIWDTGRNGNTE